MLKTLFILTGLAGWSLSLPVQAEILHIKGPCQKGALCAYAWPVLPEVEGWKQDVPASMSHNIHALAREGESFNDSETVMYAEVEKFSVSGCSQVECFVQKTKDDLLKALQDQALEKKPAQKSGRKKENSVNLDPQELFKDMEEWQTGDGTPVKILRYQPPGGEGNWEVGAYATEQEFGRAYDPLNDEAIKDYYLIFIISSTSRTGLEKHLPAFKKMVTSYRQSIPRKAPGHSAGLPGQEGLHLALQ